MDKARMAIYSLAGVYLLFLAYNLINGISTAEGLQKILGCVFAVVFAGIGIGGIIWCVKQNRKLKQSTQAAASKTEESTDER